MDEHRLNTCRCRGSLRWGKSNFEQGCSHRSVPRNKTKRGSFGISEFGFAARETVSPQGVLRFRSRGNCSSERRLSESVILRDLEVKRELWDELWMKHLVRIRNPKVTSVIAFHEKAGRSQYNSCLASLNKFLFSRRVATVAMLPSALSRSDSSRSVQVGRSRFSRCCYLFGALWFCSSE